VFASVAGAGQVVTIDEDTAAVLARAPAGQFPDGLAYVPTTGQVWVSDESGGAETVLDAQTGRAVATVLESIAFLATALDIAPSRRTTATT
jgi:DNA-binding beta-propeller fold protein YncE